MLWSGQMREVGLRRIAVDRLLGWEWHECVEEEEEVAWVGSVFARRRSVEGYESQRQVLVWEARLRRVLRRIGGINGSEVP